MVGIVVSKTGVGGITINIPTQFDVIVHKMKVITASPEGGAEMAEALKTIPDSVKSMMQESAAQATALLGSVMPSGNPHYDSASNSFVEGLAGPGQALKASAQQLAGKMQGFVDVATGNANGTMIASMRQLIAIGEVPLGGSVDDVINAALGVTQHPNPELGGVQQSAQQLQKFADIAQSMSHRNGELGGAMAQIESIAKNAAGISKMATLAGGVAEACGLPAPPSIEGAFSSLSNGTIGNALNTLNAGMSVTAGIAMLPTYSGHLDDMNDLIWQGKVGNGLGLPYAGITLPAPTWTNPNEFGGTTEGTFPTGVAMGEALENAKNEVLDKVEEVHGMIEESLAPISQLADAVALSTGLDSLPSFCTNNLSGSLMGLAQTAYSDLVAASDGSYGDSSGFM
jgi:hypothetical protein